MAKMIDEFANWTDVPLARLKSLTPNMRKAFAHHNIDTAGQFAAVDDLKNLLTYGVGIGTIEKAGLSVRDELLSLGYTFAPRAEPGVTATENVEAVREDDKSAIIDEQRTYIQELEARADALKNELKRALEKISINIAGSQPAHNQHAAFVEEFVLRRASAVTGELTGAQAVYEANKAWQRIVEVCGE